MKTKFLFTSLLFLVCSSLMAKSKRIDYLVYQVNEIPVLYSDIVQSLDLFLMLGDLGLSPKVAASQLETFVQEAEKYTLQQALLEDFSSSREISVSESEINQQIDSIAANLKTSTAKLYQKLITQFGEFGRSLFINWVRSQVKTAKIQQIFILGDIDITEAQISQQLNSLVPWRYDIEYLFIFEKNDKSQNLIDRWKASSTSLTKSDEYRALSYSAKLQQELPSIISQRLQEMEVGELVVFPKQDELHVIRLVDKTLSQELLTPFYLMRAEYFPSFELAAKFQKQQKQKLLAKKDLQTKWLKPKNLAQDEFETVANMQARSVSKPQLTEAGYLVVVLEDQESRADEQTLRTFVQNRLKLEAAQEAMVLWLAQLQENAFVEKKSDIAFEESRILQSLNPKMRELIR